METAIRGTPGLLGRLQMEVLAAEIRLLMKEEKSNDYFWKKVLTWEWNDGIISTVAAQSCGGITSKRKGAGTDSKKVEKSTWQMRKSLVWYQTLRFERNGRSKSVHQLKAEGLTKKVEKSTWQAQNDVLKWLSCRESAADGTLIIEQWQPWKFERISSEKRTLNSKTRMD